MTNQTPTTGRADGNKVARRTRRQLLVGGTGAMAAALAAEAFVRPTPAWAANGNVTAIIPSGDTSGATDTMNIVSALASSNNTALLADGNFYVTANRVLLKTGQSLIHLGEKTNCTVFQVGSAAGFTIGATNSTGVYQENSFVTFAGITTNGSMMTKVSGATGWQIGDIAQVFINDCSAHGFETGKGWYFVNQYFYTEQIHGFLHVSDCQNLVVFDCAPVLPQGQSMATGSFERMELVCWFAQTDGAFNVVTFQNGAFCGNGSLKIYGNCHFVVNTGEVGGSVLTITGQLPPAAVGSGKSFAFSNLQHMELNIGVELPNSTGLVVPNTITFGNSPNNYMKQCHGNLDFKLGPGTFAPATRIAYDQFDFVGPIRGDDTLLAQVGAGETWITLSSGLPTGWGGQVRFKPRAEAGLITVRVELTIAAGTVIAQGETILSGLAAMFTPKSNEAFPAMLYDPSGTPSITIHPITISAAGILQANQSHTMGQDGSLSITHTYANSI